jgi:serine/threonine-protein kinase
MSPTAEEWKQVVAVFHNALEHPPGERAAVVRSASLAPELRREVLALLEEAGRSGPLEDLARAFLDPRTLPGRPGDGQPGDLHRGTVGPYRLLEEIGRGGMGVVYRAERDDGQFEQEVAIKMLYERSGDGTRIDRFLNERQILAGLVHPHIARLLDGGVQQDGTPYFVMEYVDGATLTAYAREHGLSLRARLKLFDDVLEAVEHAHRHLVVHRDLKPSNVLVDASGTVKLLDFGIAKLLDASGGSDVRTRTGALLLTPEYASPEQIRQETITTATDVYALGALLYELLTGRRPYDLTDRTPSEVEQVVCETEPVPPSRRVQERVEGETGSSTAPETPAHRLRGDLDTIVLKALQKDPRRRYPRAASLKADLRRYRDGRPVRAQPDRFGYRLQKFVRRHRTQVAAVLVVVLALIGGIAGTTWQAIRADEQSRIAEAERDRAQQEAEKASEVAAFLAGLFRAPDPSQARGDTLTAYDLLARGRNEIERTLQTQPLVRATLFRTLGETYTSMGEYDRAAPLLDSAVLLQDVHGAPPAEYAETIRSLALAEMLGGRSTRAGSLYAVALSLQEVHLGKRAVEVAETLARMAGMHHERGEYEEAEAAYRRAIAVMKDHGGEPIAAYASALQHLALLLQEKDQMEEAMRLFDTALSVQRERIDGPHPDLALLLNDAGMAHQRGGNREQAERLLREAVSMQETLFGTRHPQIVFTLSNLAVAVQERDLGQADSLSRRALQVARDIFRPTNPTVATTLALRARIVHRTGDLPAAGQLSQEAVEAARQAFPAGHPRIGWAQVGWARILSDQGDHLRAERLFTEGIAVLETAFGPTHSLVLRAQRWYADALLAAGNRDEADALLRRQHERLQAAGADERETRETARRLARLNDRP